VVGVSVEDFHSQVLFRTVWPAEKEPVDDESGCGLGQLTAIA
jgi:hypothetical protein